MTARPNGCKSFLQRRRHRERDHIQSAHHNLADSRFSKLNDGVDQVSLIFFNGAMCLPDLCNRTEVFKGEPLSIGPREPLLQALREPCDEPGQRREQTHEHGHHAGDPAAVSHGVFGGDQLRCDLADHEQHKGQHDDLHDDNHRIIEVVGQGDLCSHHRRQDSGRDVYHRVQQQDGDQ